MSRKTCLIDRLIRMFRLQQETAEVELASVASFCESVETSLSK